MQPFHLAFPVKDIEASINFYCRYFDCTMGRRTDHWVDFNFYGHQLSLHLQNSTKNEVEESNLVDGDTVSIPHFGVILDKAVWVALHLSLQEEGVEFILKPKTRFAGKPGEQGTFFIKDPSSNTLEFKYFSNTQDIFNT